METMKTKKNNPHDFELDLSAGVLAELDLYTQWARRRLLERDVSIAERKRCFYEGKDLDRPLLLIADFPARMIGEDLYDYYTDTVVHYKAFCAALARFGEDYVFPYTATWEYRFVELLGGRVARIPDKAPETLEHPVSNPEDLGRLPALDYDSLVAEDMALKRYFDRHFSDLLGSGMYVSLDPFSQVCSLLRDPQSLLMDIIDRPDFVHQLCEYMLDVQIEVIKRVLAEGPATIFSPGYTLMLSPRQFKTFALPYIEKLVDTFPGVPMLIGSGGNATHLIEPLMQSNVPVPFIDGASDLAVAVDKARQYDKPFTVLFPRTLLVEGDRDKIRAATRQILSTVKDTRFYYWTEAILGGDVPNQTIDLFLEAYREYARFSDARNLLEEGLGEAPPVIQKVAAPECIDLDQVAWDPDGEEAIKKAVPFMFRSMAKREVNKIAAEQGVRRITAEVFERIKKGMGY